jgi:hypothetical protein
LISSRRDSIRAKIEEWCIYKFSAVRLFQLTLIAFM